MCVSKKLNLMHEVHGIFLGYVSASFGSDISLLRLSSAIDISSSTVEPISLPCPGDSLININELSCFVSGWGDTDTSEIDFDTDISILIHSDGDQTTCESCNSLKHYGQLN